MGLLQKANDNKFSLAQFETQKKTELPLVKKKIRIDDFLIKVKSFNQGFEYAGKLFEELSFLLDFNKGALLALELDINTLIPISFKNFDLTTSRHLRIPGNIFSNQFKYFNQIIYNTDKNIKIFKQYFSIREFSALESLIIIPLYKKDTLSALLLIIDPSTDILDIVKDLSLVSDKFISKLLDSRKPFTISEEIISKNKIPEPQLVLQEYIDNNNNNNNDNVSYIIVKINFELLKNTLVNLLPNTDLYEINNNIRTSIIQLISPTGKLLKVDSTNYLLFYKIKKGKSSGIILHQINLAISTFFNLVEPLPKIETKIKTFIYDSHITAESILEGFI